MKWKSDEATSNCHRDYSTKVSAGTNLFFVNFDNIEHQHVAGVKAPTLQVIDTEGKISGGKLEVTSNTTHKILQIYSSKK